MWNFQGVWTTIPLSSLKVSDLYTNPCGFYRSLNEQNRICELCTFSQIWSHIVIHIGRAQTVLLIEVAYCICIHKNIWLHTSSGCCSFSFRLWRQIHWIKIYICQYSYICTFICTLIVYTHSCIYVHAQLYICMFL